MVTFFTTAKPFHGHSAIIQRNALKSWTLLHPDVEVILLGDDEGAAEVARELGIRHEPHVERSEFGTNRLDYMFAKAQAIARHDVLCYANCDIILMADFLRALEQVKAAHARFLMVGRRWDADITEPINFFAPDWAAETRLRALTARRQREEWWIDYFAFSRGLFGAELLPFGVGQPYWDNWLIWQTIQAGHPVVNASAAVIAVHQNHDYHQRTPGRKGPWDPVQSERNFRLAGGYAHLRTIEGAQFRFVARGIASNPFYWCDYWRMTVKRWAEPVRWFLQTWVWHPALNFTRPARHALGLKQGNLQWRNRR